MRNPDNTTPKLSRQYFNEGIQSLAILFGEHNSLKSYRSRGDGVALHKWELKKDSFPDDEYYLYHPPFLQRIKNEESFGGSIETNHDEYDSMEYEYDVIMDSAVASTNKITTDSRRYLDIEWSFSIVYSRVWNVPVLYFQVQNVNGALLTRNKVMKILVGPNGNTYALNDNHGTVISDQDDGWDFVSVEEHPITGVPTFFFHPCQTSNRMNLIYKGVGSVVVSNPGKWILSWMSMILPAAGFQILPKLFHEFCDALESLD